MEKEFQAFRLNDKGVERAANVSEKFNALLLSIFEAAGCPRHTPTRELAIVATKLEEASFFAKKAIAMREGHSFKD